MELDITKAFLAPGNAFPFQVELDLPPQNVGGEIITFDRVSLEGKFTLYDEAVVLEGTLKTVAHGECALCMEPADVPVQLDFAENFRKDANETEDVFFRYEGKSVPLDHMALTLAMLDLPMRFVCKDGCEGSAELQAWKNENPTSSCEDGSPTQRPFEALQSLLKKDEEV